MAVTSFECDSCGGHFEGEPHGPNWEGDYCAACARQYAIDDLESLKRNHQQQIAHHQSAIDKLDAQISALKEKPL